MPAVSVIVPVFNRTDSLRRALHSIAGQSMRDFECIVVDDASTTDTQAIISEFDERFKLVRREANGGPFSARLDGYAAATSPLITNLDSDWEFYPWALERGAAALEEYGSVDIACGLHLRSGDSRMFVRVREAPRLVHPPEFRTQEPIPDRIAMVRRCVVERWLAIGGSYFSMEAQQWITAELHHSQIALDEPWVRYHTDSDDRITGGAQSSTSRRVVDDASQLVRHRIDLIDAGPCVSIDRLVEEAYFRLWRANHPDEHRAAEALARRGLTTARAKRRVAAARLRHRLAKDTVRWV